MNRLLIEIGLSADEREKISEYLNPVKRTFERGEIILELSEENDDIGFLTAGTAYLVSTDSEGQTGIMNYYKNSGLFGKPLSSESIGGIYYITAKTKCEVCFVSFPELLKLNNNKLAKYIIEQSAKRYQIHVEILSQRSIRAKLSCFFRYLSKESQSRQVHIPITLSDLADYLAVDRSSMMRELKKMNQEGLIHSDGKKILLINLN